ncbi:hypothetical protein L208DRAFT_1343736 [Tricholoma matsutake]|nr:hypothetical protein L208DRAFT_1343736 [Tricholoma matsutake 945]
MPTFCDDIHPSILPLLVHTDLAHYSHLTCPLIIHTGLPSSVRPIRTCRERNRWRSLYNAVSTSSLESACGGPLPQQVRETIAEDTDGQQVIRKPPGEAGRPGWGVSIYRSSSVRFFMSKWGNRNRNRSKTDPDIAELQPDRIGPVHISPWTKKNQFEPTFCCKICCTNITHIFLNNN